MHVALELVLSVQDNIAHQRAMENDETYYLWSLRYVDIHNVACTTTRTHMYIPVHVHVHVRYIMEVM